MSPGFFPLLVSPSMSNSVVFEGFLFTHFSQLILSTIEFLVSSFFSEFRSFSVLTLNFAYNSYFHSCWSITSVVYLLFLAFLSVQLFMWSIQYLFNFYVFSLFPYKVPKPNQTWVQDNSINFETGFRKRIFLLLLGEKGRSFRSLTFNIGNRSLIHRKTLLTEVFWDVMAFL